MKSESPERMLSELVADWRRFTSLPVGAREAKAFVLKAVARDRRIYSLLPLRLQADREVLLQALTDRSGRDDSPLEHAPASLRDDLEVIMCAIKVRLRDFDYASERIRTQASMLCKLVEANRALFQYLDAEIRANRDVAMAALRVHGSNLYYASDALKADKQAAKLSLATCKPFDQPLTWWHETLRDDRELVEMAIEKAGGGALTHASRRLLKDRELIKTALTKGGVGKMFGSFPASVRRDRELCLLAVTQSEWAFRYVDDSLMWDEAFCLEAVRANPNCLNFIPARMRSRRAFKKDSTINPHPSPERVRYAFLAALKAYKADGPLSGRGHVARVTLNGRTAACLRRLELPRVYMGWPPRLRQPVKTLGTIR